MKFLKVTSYYPDFVRFASNKYPELPMMDYDKQMEYLFSFAFAWSDFWKRHLEEANIASVTEIIYNVDFVQKKWAQENGIKYSSDNWQSEILEAQIAFYKPEIIFFEDYTLPPVEYKRKFPFVKFIISWDGLALMDPDRYEGADIIASCHRGTVDYYTSRGQKSYLFMFGFETSILEKLEKRTPSYNASFVGSLNIYKNGHKERLKLLQSIRKTVPLDCWISGASRVDLLSIQALKYLAKGMITDIYRLNDLLQSNRGYAFGLDMYQILRDSKITLNSHIDAAGPYAANIRLFEATGTGTCLVTDWKKNMPELFDIDKEVVVYRSREECAEKVKWLLENENERKKIAEGGQKKTLQHYALKDRVLSFFNTISF